MRSLEGLGELRDNCPTLLTVLASQGDSLLGGRYGQRLPRQVHRCPRLGSDGLSEQAQPALRA